jgi:hypothetical protein
VDYQLKYVLTLQSTIVESVKAEVVLDGQDPYGKIKGGSLVLNSMLAFGQQMTPGEKMEITV